MQALRPVTVDLATGVITLGSTQVTLERHGEQYIAPGGLLVRALTFGERSSVVAGALMDPEPNRALLAKLRHFSNVLPDTESRIADALVLALAGGGETAPPFAECARTACRNANLDWNSVHQSAAVLVDQLAGPTDSPCADDGWTRFEFREVSESSPSLEDCCRQMLEKLLERGTPQEAEQELPPGPGFSPSRAPLRAAQEDSPGDPPDSIGDGVLSEKESAWRSATQPLRARATLPRAVEVPQAATLKLPKASSPVSGALREITLGSVLSEASPSAPDKTASTQAAGRSEESRTAELAEGWHGEPIANSKSHSTLWDAIPPGNQVPRLPRVSVGTSSASTGRIAAPVMAKTRARPHRLRDLPTRSAESLEPAIIERPSPSPSPTGMSSLALSEDTTTDSPQRAVSLQHDWIHEIAAALADECDLRGLDA